MHIYISIYLLQLLLNKFKHIKRRRRNGRELFHCAICKLSFIEMKFNFMYVCVYVYILLQCLKYFIYIST